MAAVLVSHSQAPCHPVDGERILMRDLAKAEPRFEAADPAQAVGFAPQPGAKRIFWPAELISLSTRSAVSVTEPFHQVCFERRARLVSEAEIVSAIRAWAPEQSQVVILEQSNPPAPAGQLVLPRPAFLKSAQDGSVMLRGYVLYDVQHHFPIWARVRFRMDREVAISTADVAEGTAIRDDQVRMERRSGGLEVDHYANNTSLVAGRIARKRIAAGEPIPLTSLLEPRQVNRGAVVRIEVRDGATRLLLDGRAETSGRTGDLVTVRNPSSGRAFQARVTGTDFVLVTPRGAQPEVRPKQ